MLGRNRNGVSRSQEERPAEENERVVLIRDDYEVEETAGGLTPVRAGLLIVGELAGSGVLALPQAVEFSAQMGLPLLLVLGLVSAYTGRLLGMCWSLVQDRYPQYRGHQRFPFPAMGRVCFGNRGRMTVATCIDITLFGAGVVFLILAAQNLNDLLNHATSHMSFCYSQFIITAIFFVLIMFGSPKDFWGIGALAAAATGIACVIVTVNIGLDSVHHGPVTHSPATWLSMASAFGTMTWAFCGHPAYPSFQTDMLDHTKFSSAIIVGYAVVFLMYIPVAAGGYFVFGQDIQSNVLMSLSPGPCRIIVTVLITLHLLFAFVIVINPVCQEVEEFFGVRRSFHIWRVFVRTLVVLLVLFIAQTLPHFGILLSLVGGSTTCLLSFVFPPIIYLKLSTMEGDWPKLDLGLGTWVLNIVIVVVGIIAGLASTYSAIASMAGAETFVIPCYLNFTLANGD